MSSTRSTRFTISAVLLMGIASPAWARGDRFGASSNLSSRGRNPTPMLHTLDRVVRPPKQFPAEFAKDHQPGLRNKVRTGLKRLQGYKLNSNDIEYKINENGTKGRVTASYDKQTGKLRLVRFQGEHQGRGITYGWNKVPKTKRVLLEMLEHGKSVFGRRQYNDFAVKHLDGKMVFSGKKSLEEVYRTKDKKITMTRKGGTTVDPIHR